MTSPLSGINGVFFNHQVIRGHGYLSIRFTYILEGYSTRDRVLWVGVSSVKVWFNADNTWTLLARYPYLGDNVSIFCPKPDDMYDDIHTI